MMVVALLAAGSSACYSQYPLDPAPSVKADTRLVGIWRCIPPDAESSDSALVTIKETKGPDRQYEIAWQEADKTADRYRAFASVVGESTFLNVGDADGLKVVDAAGASQKEGWAFVRYSLPRPNILHVEIVPERVFANEASSKSFAAARTTLEEALNRSPAVIDEMAVCVRKSK